MNVAARALATRLASRTRPDPRPRPGPNPSGAELTPRARRLENKNGGSARLAGLQGLQRRNPVVTGLIERKQSLKRNGYRLQRERLAYVRIRARVRNVCCNPVTCNHETYMIDLIEQSWLQRGYNGYSRVTDASPLASASAKTPIKYWGWQP